MKRLCCLPVICLLSLAPLARGQDNATAAAIAPRQEEIDERFKRLSGQLDDILKSQADQLRRLGDLEDAVKNLRDQQSRPNATYASQEDLKRLADAIKEVDNNRLKDYEKIREEIGQLGKVLAAPSTSTPVPTRPSSRNPVDAGPKQDENGYWYVVKRGDFLSTIAKAFNEQGVKVTLDQIEKANPNVDSTKLRIGQKIFIPAPKDKNK
jgi:nucleoid-associated protein YgaU